MQVIETKARQSVSKQELSARVPKEPQKETKPKEPPLEEPEILTTDDPGYTGIFFRNWMPHAAPLFYDVPKNAVKILFSMLY